MAGVCGVAPSAELTEWLIICSVVAVAQAFVRLHLTLALSACRADDADGLTENVNFCTDLFLFFFVYRHFACRYVCVTYACLVHTEDRR